MSYTGSGLPPEVEKWTEEDVHLWLTTEVKVHHTCADKFREEDVLGEYLVDFEKKDVLDFGIKHGPAVKIISFVEQLKKGSKHESQCPAYVEKWTKEQVYQWLVDYVKLYPKYAQRLQEEEVSGDCLVCFTKQDLLDLDVKGGPAVKILAELRKLDRTHEPTLQPSTHVSSEPAVSPTHVESQPPSVSPKHVERQPYPSASELVPVSTEEPVKVEDKRQSPKQHASQNNEAKPLAAKPSEVKSKKKINNVSMPRETVLLQRTLEDLGKDDVEKFIFILRQSDVPGYPAIALSHVENKSIVQLVELMTKHYGMDTALDVTLKVLDQIPRSDLALRLKKDHLQVPLNTKKDLRREAEHGEKLKNLLTCGANCLDYYKQFVVVVNKSQVGQQEHLEFLSKLDLFCVLDFDPCSAQEGVCHSYRSLRAANLHTPTLFQSEANSLIKTLNLYKQTSWVLCNGRHDLESEFDEELDYTNWLIRKRKDIENLVSFICKPDVLPIGKTLVIFLLLSPIQGDKDPIVETFLSFYSHIGEANIASICASQEIFENWKGVVLNRYQYDITMRSVYELNLSQINGKVMELGPHNQPSGRLLPSSDSSSVVLTKRDEDYMPALDILCQNECENVYDESSHEFKALKIKVEEEFYRGSKVKWWNFYFCEKLRAKPFIKRDKYDNLMKSIKNQASDPKATCISINLFHNPGCGATSLAMHVMWDLRREFRCAILKDNASHMEVTYQVKKLAKFGKSEKPTTVLLLVDDSKEENTQSLVNCIRKTIDEEYAYRTVQDFPDTPQVIILSCIRSPYPQMQYQQCRTPCQFITAKLTKKEQEDFDEKLKEIQETHKMPENFYSFMIMKSNFDEKYVAGLVRNTLEDLDITTKKARLLTFLALVITYVAEAHISLSLCKDFLQMSMVHWPCDSVLERMEPYANFLIEDSIEDWGGFKAIKLQHPCLATACLEELGTYHNIKRSDIALDMLHCDLFFKTTVVKDTFLKSVLRMLVERQRRTWGDERDTQFAPLIEDIRKHEGGERIEDIFIKASQRFEDCASIPQALARYLYLNENDFPKALKYAEDAKRITENSYTVDTIGQVYKSNLKHKMNNKKKICNPKIFRESLELAEKAIKAFQRAQHLAKRQTEPDEDYEINPFKRYNTSGHLGEMEIVLTVLEMISNLPFFDEADPQKKKYMQSFLKGVTRITSVPDIGSEDNVEYFQIIQEYLRFLLVLNNHMKKVFEFFNSYFTYVKPESDAGDFFLLRNRKKISEHFDRYIELMCSTPEEIFQEQASKSALRLNSDLETHRMILEQENADTFPGLLQFLDQSPEESDFERIAESYAFLCQYSPKNKNNIKETTCFILANIILHCLRPNSTHMKNNKDLTDILLALLQDIGLQHPFPEPYYVALLLLWPRTNDEDTHIVSYVNSLCKSSQKQLSHLLRKRRAVAHFYLGRRKGKGGVISKSQLGRCFPVMEHKALAQLWMNGDIFKEKEIKDRLQRVNGVLDAGVVYAIYGKNKIPVHPAYAGIRSGFSTEKVSFYLGFAINGPLAYDIQYEN